MPLFCFQLTDQHKSYLTAGYDIRLQWLLFSMPKHLPECGEDDLAADFMQTHSIKAVSWIQKEELAKKKAEKRILKPCK